MLVNSEEMTLALVCLAEEATEVTIEILSKNYAEVKKEIVDLELCWSVVQILKEEENILPKVTEVNPRTSFSIRTEGVLLKLNKLCTKAIRFGLGYHRYEDLERTRKDVASVYGYMSSLMMKLQVYHYGDFFRDTLTADKLSDYKDLSDYFNDKVDRYFVNFALSLDVHVDTLRDLKTKAYGRTYANLVELEILA